MYSGYKYYLYTPLFSNESVLLSGSTFRFRTIKLLVLNFSSRTKVQSTDMKLNVLELNLLIYKRCDKYYDVQILFLGTVYRDLNLFSFQVSRVV